MRKAQRLLAIVAVMAGIAAPSPLIAPAIGAAGTAAADQPPTGDELLAKLAACRPVTKKPLRPADDAPRSVPVCGMKGAVYAQTGLLVDCDGQRTEVCNEKTDCCFQNDTAFHQTDGQPLDAARLPYIVLPRAGANWDWHANGIDGGSVAALIYHHKLTYAVFGDTDSPDKVPQGSYATAAALGMNPDPRDGGVDSGVTYIVFENTTANPIESPDSAVAVGRQAAQAFLENN